MDKLITKVHYNTFEKGEYTDEMGRSLAETIDLINNYPWQQQRQLADVQLTCPSVTIERNTDSYLRIGPYFNNKYCLYLFEDEKVYEKVFLTLNDTFDTIEAYFLNKDLTTGFEKQHMLRKAKSHFITNQFVYSITGNSILSFLFFPELFTLVLFLSLPLSIIMIGKEWAGVWPALLFVVFIILPLFGFNFYLFFNYYRYSKDKLIKISQGSDTFYYGNEGNYNAYSKKEISSINIQLTKNYKSPWREYNVYEINFKNGEQIRFPSLLLQSMTFITKFPDIPLTEQYIFLPTI